MSLEKVAPLTLQAGFVPHLTSRVCKDELDPLYKPNMVSGLSIWPSAIYIHATSPTGLDILEDVLGKTQFHIE